jgi:RimJ/RimL family protein N-acetyltransferase
MQIQVSDEIQISPIHDTDKPAYLEHLKEKEISQSTLRIPYPYTSMDADEWLRMVRAYREENGIDLTYAIRNKEGYLIGGIGFDGFVPGRDHKAEVGYWLAKPYWGKGIMTQVLLAVTEHGFKELALARISANVMAFNTPSARVLEKCGYELEGIATKYYYKGGEFIDAKLYAKVR